MASHPHTTLNGDYPYALCTVAFNTNSTYANSSSQSYYEGNQSVKYLLLAISLGMIARNQNKFGTQLEHQGSPKLRHKS